MANDDSINNNSASAFEQMYISNYHKIKSFCNYYLRDPELSKCIAQDVFVSVWNNRGSLCFSNELLPYLFVLAKNMCLNVLKREKVKANYNRIKGNLDNGGGAPTNFLIDRKGNIVFSHFRTDAHNQDVLEEMISSLLKRK